MPFTANVPKFDNVIHLLEKTKQEANPFTVILLGGEPFLRHDIIRIIDVAHATFNGKVGISTNGTKLSELSKTDLNRLRELNKDYPIIQVSFDSTDPKINNLTRGVTNPTLEGLVTLEKNGINFEVGIVVTRLNISDIPRTIKDLLTTFKHLKALNLEELQPASTFGDEFDRLYPSLSDSIDMNLEVRQLIRSSNRGDVRVAGIIEHDGSVSESIKMLRRNTINNNAVILARAGVFVDGSVSVGGVIVRNDKIGNLYHESWKEIWSKARDRVKHT